MSSLFILLFSIFSALPSVGNLIISFDKPVDRGNLLVFVYDKPDGFPKNKKLIFRKEIVKCQQTKQIILSDLPYKTYAIIVIHDVNNNKKIDRNWIGFPSEPYSISGKHSFRLGPPLYKDAQFNFKADNQVLHLSF